jgi:hypothetical protein
MILPSTCIDTAEAQPPLKFVVIFPWLPKKDPGFRVGGDWLEFSRHPH